VVALKLEARIVEEKASKSLSEKSSWVV